MEQKFIKEKLPKDIIKLLGKLLEKLDLYKYQMNFKGQTKNYF